MKTRYSIIDVIINTVIVIVINYYNTLLLSIDSIF